ncbi:MAG: NAD(P)/FAD-dependent oxidoreductase [Planctomycetota bacterium]|nr:NAD(P)/FAD-dependent oxidoreductase [Planctomycetota bacterium]
MAAASGHYDALIIGAGLSGLAAGLRLAHFGRRVLICESHSAPGGLSSWFSRQGRDFDVALHAFTNYAPPGRESRALQVLLRQLRLRREDLDLVEQEISRIAFPGCSLRFSNDPDLIASEIERQFPGEIDGFIRLRNFLRAYPETALDVPAFQSSRAMLARFLREPLLQDMLACPVMYYGNAGEDDMDLPQFALIWKAIFESGFAMPRHGMRPVVELLVNRLQAAGGEIRLRTRVERLRAEQGWIRAARLASGEEIAAAQFYSSAGRVETIRLCSDQPANALRSEEGKISVVEAIARLNRSPRDAGCHETILFFCRQPRLRFRRPEREVDTDSGVVCVPSNYRHTPPLDDRIVRFSALANYQRWRALQPARDDAVGRARYAEAKKKAAADIFAAVAAFGLDIAQHVEWLEVFTPLTIQRYTGHVQGAIYGAAQKNRRGLTPYGNLFLLGADQGFLGIVGAMLSGITIANLHGLRP